MIIMFSVMSVVIWCCYVIVMQLDSRVSELSRAKADLETRIEEDQDEIEELLEKQRTHISQTSHLQKQVTDANLQIEELMEDKINLESKVSEKWLYSKIPINIAKSLMYISIDLLLCAYVG